MSRHSTGARRAAVLEALAGGVVRTQADLLDRLRESGFPVTQACVSRDLREVGARKVGGRYQVDPGKREALRAVGDLVDFIEPAGPNILIIRTPPGGAQRVAHAIDTAGWPETVGSVAGDDTILVASRDRAGQKALRSRLSGMVAPDGATAPDIPPPVVSPAPRAVEDGMRAGRAE